MPLKKDTNKTSHKQTTYGSYRIIDANFNRCKEGLRVCEEIIRFHLNNKRFSKNFNGLRHALTNHIKKSNIDQKMLFKCRNSRQDVGQAFSCGPKRTSFKNIFLANSQRAKEALRVLEEFSKLIDATLSKKIQHLRFEYYELEKATIKKFPALLDPR